MSSRQPYISIVIPTRNRPALLDYVLRSLLLQTFADFEVIVCDNHTGKPCRHVFEQYADQRFRYITPPTPLSMHDNWQFACDLARGEYVTVLMDKSILRPSALQIIHDLSIQDHPEIISWWNETFYLLNEDAGYEHGRYVSSSIKPSGPRSYDPKVELTRRISCGSSVKSDAEGGCYYWGKICFGAYHQNLVKRISSALGKLIFPISPDYTSMVAALAFAEGAIDVGEPLSITFSSKLSNGYICSIYPEHAFAALHGIDPTDQLIQDLPIKGLYASVHNIVAYDYVAMKEKIGKPMQSMELNMRNLVLLAKDDLDNVVWSDEIIRENQMEIWRRYYQALPIQLRFALLLKRAICSNVITRLIAQSRRRLSSLLKIIAQNMGAQQSNVQSRASVSCKTIIEASRLAEDIYLHRKT